MADKTATIKLRLTAEEKANWEAQAEADATTLSSLIRRRMNHPTTRADGVLETAPSGLTLKQQLALNPTTPTPFFGGGDLGAAIGTQGFSLTGPGVVASTDSPRRTTVCEHGRPQYVYCPTCD